MHIDFKIKIWERIRISDEIADEVLEKIKNKEIKSSIQLFQIYGDKAYDFSSENLHETEEAVLPEENNGCATLEVYDQYNDLLWDNSENHIQWDKL